MRTCLSRGLQLNHSVRLRQTIRLTIFQRVAEPADPEACVAPVASTIVFKETCDFRQENHRLKFAVKLMIENYKWQIFTQNFNLWNQNLE